LVLLVRRGRREFRGLRDPKDRLALQGRPGLPASGALQARPVFQDPQVQQ
jgi:hypothetical protein